VARFAAALRARGVSVLFPYLAWDTGTQREGVRDEETVVAQGINGDSIPFVPRSFWDAPVAAGYPIALQAEGGASDAALGWSTLGWGYWGRQSNQSRIYPSVKYNYPALSNVIAPTQFSVTCVSIIRVSTLRTAACSELT